MLTKEKLLVSVKVVYFILIFWKKGNINLKRIISYVRIEVTKLMFDNIGVLDSSAIQSPAKDFGWHDPGFIHSAVMTQLHPSTTYSYKYGRYFYFKPPNSKWLNKKLKL